MRALMTTGRKVGALYLVFALFSVLNEYVLSAGFIIPGDAAATAHNIISREFAYRVGILSSFVDLVLFVTVVVALHDLFRGVDERLNLAMVVFVSLGVAVSLGNLVYKATPLSLLSADYWSSFSRNQLETLSLGALGQRSSGNTIAMMFWGLWLFPLGLLAIKSAYMPRFVGVLVLVAGLAYFITGATGLVAPGQQKAVSKFIMPFYFGELVIVFWLLIRGAKAPPAAAPAAST